jgi:hypothetical protein
MQIGFVVYKSRESRDRISHTWAIFFCCSLPCTVQNLILISVPWMDNLFGPMSTFIYETMIV